MTSAEFPWADLLTGGQLQHVNLVFVGGHDSSRLAQLLLTMLVNAVDPQGGPLFRHVLVLLPPDLTDTMAHAVAAEMLRKRGAPLDDQERVALGNRLVVRQSSTLDAAHVIDTVANAPTGSFVVIVDAARYRPVQWELPSPASLQSAEDRWTMPMANLARECSARVENSVCVVMDAGEYLPRLGRNRAALEDLECTVWGVEDPHAADDPLVDRLEEWVRRVERGDVVSVLAEIDGQPTLSDQARTLCKVQVLYKGGRSVRALELLQPLNWAGVPADVKLKLATVAMGSDDNDLARRLLESSAADLRDLDNVELALELSQTLASPTAARHTADWLIQCFPNSVILKVQQLRRMLLAARELVVVKPLGSSAAPLEDYATYLTTALSCAETPDFVALAEDIDTRWPGRAIDTGIAMALNARGRNLPLHAVALVVATDPASDFARNAANVALWSIEQLLLIDDDFSKEALSDAVLFMLLYLAETPADTASRERLDELLSVDISGSVGVALLAHCLLRLASQPQPAQAAPELTFERPDDARMTAFLSAALQWLAQLRAVDLATTRLPVHLMTVPADSALEYLGNMVKYTLKQEEEDDTTFLRSLVIAAFAIAPHATRKNVDLEILRMANSRLVMSGEMQTARDLAEAGLAASHGRPERLRLAWYSYGDVYHRAANHSRALMYFGCALATQAAVDAEQAYHETMGIVRALRDTGLLDHAERLLGSCETLLQQLPRFEENQQRIATMRVGLRLHALSAARSTDAAAWTSLLKAADANLQAVLAANDELAPILVLAAQIVRHLSALGAPVDADVRARIAAAGAQVGQITQGLVDLAANEARGAEQLVELTRAVLRTRYADDVGFDVQWLVRAARAELTQPATANDPELASYAAELTADHAISVPGGALGGWLPATLQAPMAILQAVSRQGLRVEVLAVDSDERMVRVSAEGGTVSVTRESEAFSLEALHDWSRRFPFDYGFDSLEPNLFYTSMQRLGLSETVGTRTLFVLDTRLQRLPPQLLLVNDELIGRATSVAVAPSLTWLEGALANPRQRYGPAAAWISTTAHSEAAGTLATVAARVGDTLQEHGVVLSTAEEVPVALQGAELAIVAAHGGLADGNRFFKVVSDEAKFRVSGLALAQALQGAGVVVLFVCSGGRQDEHPVASTTVGLPKQLLERGSLAVIASPWPLDSRVPSHWLPGFLEAWYAGEPLIDANAAANRRVASQMGDDPRLTMAMTLYGNPLLRRQELSRPELDGALSASAG